MHRRVQDDRPTPTHVLATSPVRELRRTIGLV